MKKLLSIVFLFFTSAFFAQSNLVLNPSFEDTIACPSSKGNINPFLKNWHNPTASSPDYYNACAAYITGCKVPYAVGFQYARTGNAYCGIFGFASVNSDDREYIQGNLLDTLNAGKKYCVRFYVCLANLSRYSISNIGAYFSNTAVSSTNYNCLPFIPQIINSSSTQLNDTLNWLLIQGDFIAVGGEKYITIGNFNTDSNTDTLLFNASPFNTSKIAYYYIDDVSVIECTDSIPPPTPPADFLIPTILTGETFFEIKSLPHFSKLYLYNTLGQLIYKNENYENNFNTINTSSGIYYYNLQLLNGNFYKGKLCVVK